ncbi:hypothetical protein O1L44_10795 [Streptomyces noursei]|nr:hypothetical protein [Streptomyces noursei]
MVGPLVVPGVSACAGCDELRRTDAEPAWPRLLAQWRSGRGTPAVPACDASLATAVAGLAAIQALAFLDGEPSPCTGARMELPCRARAPGRCGSPRIPTAAAGPPPYGERRTPRFRGRDTQQ